MGQKENFNLEKRVYAVYEVLTCSPLINYLCMEALHVQQLIFQYMMLLGKLFPGCWKGGSDRPQTMVLCRKMVDCYLQVDLCGISSNACVV